MDDFKLQQLICCSNTLMEVGSSRKLSAINIIDSIRSNSLPFEIPQLSIITIWKKNINNIINEMIDVKYVFKINDTILSEQTIKSPIDNNSLNINRSVTNVFNIVIPEEGEFIIEIHYKNKIVHSLSIDAYLIKTN